MIRNTAILLSFVLVSTRVYAADCHIDPYNFVWGADTSTHMTVKSGRKCGSTIRHGNGSGAKETVVSQPAANGVVSAPAPNIWEYNARKGYAGKDSFVVATTGESMSNRGRVSSGTTHISVDVDVTP